MELAQKVVVELLVMVEHHHLVHIALLQVEVVDQTPGTTTVMVDQPALVAAAI